MGRDVDAATHALDENFVHVQDLWELRGNGFQPPFQFRVVQQFVAGLDGGRFALDMGEDGRYFRNILSNLRLEDSDAVVGFFQAQAFVEFEVLLDVQVSGEILHADIVHIEVVARGHGADAIENIFRAQGARHRVHNDVSVGQHMVDRVGDGFRHLLRTLERNVAGHAHGEVGKVAVAGAAYAHTVDFQQTIDGRNRRNNLIAHSGGSGVKQRVNSLAGQAPTDVHD